MIQLILGSQSPRRKEILGYYKIPFMQASSNFDEESIPFCGNPDKYASKLAACKAHALKPLYPAAAILTADTIVYCNGKLYGKPKTLEEACEMFTELQGKWHSVFTGVTLIWKEHEYSLAEETKVLFNPLTSEQIQSYHQVYKWSDKAGGYGIQEGGGILIKKIDGCFYNVMGLPINSVCELLQKIGFDLWQHL